MKVARWADVSAHNAKAINSLYKLLWFAFRVCDGTFRDPMFAQNDEFVRSSKSLIGYICYSVWPRSEGSSSWQETVATLKDLLGSHHRRRLVLMDDVETWSREDLRKDFSTGLEAKRKAEVDYLYSLRPKWQQGVMFRKYYRSRDERRVIGYGNRGDLEVMAGGATKVGWKYIVLADYTPGSATPKTFLGWKVIGRQYSDGRYGDGPRGEPPFTTSDMNRASVGPRRLAAKLGLGRLRWALK